MPVKRLPVKDIDAALKAYYGTGYISNDQIRDMFGIKSGATLQRLKKPVLAEEKYQNVPIVVPHHINARIAFDVWGINVRELEQNRKKMQELGLGGDTAQ